MSKTIAYLESQLKIEKQKIQDVEQEANNHKEEVLEKQRLITELSRKNDYLQILADRSNAYKDQLSANKAQLQSQILITENQNSEIDKLIRELSEKQQVIRELSAEKNGREHMFNSINKDRHQLMENNSELESQLKKQNLKIEKLRKKVRENNERKQIKYERLETLLKAEQKKNQELTQVMAPSLQRLSNGLTDFDLEADLLRKNREMNELQSINKELSARLEEKELMLKAFLGRLGPCKTSLLASSTQTNPSEFIEANSEIKEQIQKLQKMKESGVPLELAKDVVDKLISLTDRSEIHEMARFEFQQYTSLAENYLHAIELSIQKIKDTGELIDILRNHPSFSDRFINQYWDTVIQKMKDEGSIGSECIYCFSEIESNEETLECSFCRKVTHLKCASQWLRTNRTCPYCRQKQLDPSSLS